MRGSRAQEGLNCSRRNVLMVGLAVFAAALSAFTSAATEQETASTVPIRRTARHHQRWHARRRLLWLQPGRREGITRRIDSFWLQGMQAGVKTVYDCIRAFSRQTRQGSQKDDGPTLFIHGDDD